MKKMIIKVSVCIAVFLAALIAISGIMNMGNTDLTVEMSKATFPVIYVKAGNEKVNGMNGYIRQMQGSYLRDTITPLPDNRNLSIIIETFGSKVSAISYEVRSMDTKRLVENTEVLNAIDKGETIEAHLSLKELIDPDKEYLFTLQLTLDSGEAVKYYTRIIQNEKLHAEEQVKFVRNFNQKTFDKSNAKDLALYLESNAEGDNTNYGNVDIHSNFSQITWGDLQITQETEPEIRMKEISTSTGAYELTYLVSTPNGKDKELYYVTEYYRIREGSERFFLLDFQRTMNQLFDEESNVFINNKIMLGIQSEEPAFQENEDGSVVAFVIENALYSYNNTDKKLAKLFSFYDENNFDKRTLNPEHGIKILTVDEAGNIQFLVYGYMNRGSRQGSVGVAAYRYDSQVNAIEEEIYIPYDKSFDLIRENIETLSYINNRNHLYILLDGTIYGIDLLNKNYAELVTGLTEGKFVVSESGRMVAWQVGSNKYSSDTIILKDLNNSSQQELKAESGTVIAPLGFMKEDLVYGTARRDDIVRDSAGSTVFPMYKLVVQDKSGNVVGEKNYSGEDIYITVVTLKDNVIHMTRIKRNEQSYENISNDQLIYTQKEMATKNNISVVPTENKQKIVQVGLTQNVNAREIRILTPKEVLYEGGRELVLESSEKSEDQYYVYSVKGVEGVYVEPSAAVNRAMEVAGVVVDDGCEYIWERSNRELKTQIEGISGEKETPERTGLAICLDIMMSNQGVLRNAQSYLERGETALSILQNNLEAQILDLTGCTLDAVLYYVSKGNPVLVTLDMDQSVLIVGYDEKNIIILNPYDGTIGRSGMNDSKEWFASSGNKFITYIE